MKKILLALAAMFAAATTALAAEYTIDNLEELREFMEAVHVEDFAGDTITLTADIDCERGRFNTGDPEYPSTFRGTFDGGGHVISNFVHAATGSTQEGYGVAMFDFAETGAAILNLTLEGTLPGTASGAYAAPFVLAVESPLGLFMDNCHFRGSVTNYYHAAGLVGFASSGTGAVEVPSVVLTNCSVRGEIVSTWVYTAGGLVAKGTGVQAFDCSVKGELHGGRTGGLVGEAYGDSFEGCSFGGTMRPDRETVGNCIQGGLAAETSNAVFRACTSAVGFSSRAAAAGGAAGVTHGSSAFHDCSATVEAAVPTGRFGGFVGWTAGAETFSNCTATMTVDAIPVIDPETHQTNIYSLATGGFAASVASDGALFVDCTAFARGNDLKAGFYYNQQPYSTNSLVRSNTFLRCHVVDSIAKEAGFCSSTWNCAFEGCTVRGGTGGAGFVQSAGGQPDKQYDSEYSYEQTSTFTDCSVHGTRASSGFVMIANSSDKNTHTNIFRRCRAGCIYGNSNSSGAQSVGFGSTLNKGTLVEDCAAYGIADMSHLEAGFADSIGVGVTVRRCVGAVYPRSTDTQGAGFADIISYGTTVEDCYAVYAPYASAVGPYDDQAYRYGVQGGFVRRTSIGYNADDLPIVRCFALWPLSEPVSGKQISGSFCGVTPNSTSTDYFEDCYRPAEVRIGSCHNEDAEGVGALTKAEFAAATAATMPNYDFADTWHAPDGVASSPYLDASVDADTNFWFLATVLGAEGRILVNGEAPREAYPAGSVLTIQAVSDNPDIPFAGWVGDGFADPSAQTTTYTVKNVSAIAAKFCTPIYTVDDWTNRVRATYISSDTTAYALMNDLDFTDYIASNGWNYIDGDPDYGFAGKLFGQGHTIRGLVTTTGSFNTTRALFCKLANGAEIRDLTIESSNVPGDQNTLTLAGLAASVGSGVLISNCHVKADWQGVYPESYVSPAYKSCQYYGLAQAVSGTDIRIVDCTVEGKLAGGTRACGFVGEATLNGGEIARCAVFADVSTLTNRTDGMAAGFAGSLSLSGGAVVRECFSAGVVDAAADAAGFAYEISMRDDQSQVRDCYSTAEVLSGASQNPAGFACRISDNNDEGGVLPVANCWFGGTVRVRVRASSGYQPYGFAYYLTGDVSFENCAWIEVPGVKEAGTAGVTALSQAASRNAASWPGYDFAGTWSLSEDETTPYFAWSLAEGTDFRLFAVQEEGKTVTIGESAAPGTTAEVSAVAEDDSFFCGWTGGATYTSAAVNPSALLADNHRTARCVWGKAIRTRADLAAVASDPSGTYGLAADIDLAGENWTPIGNSDYTAFSGTIYGQGHVISNMVVDTNGAVCAGLFGYLSGATIMDLTLAEPVVRGADCVGALAGFADGSTISGCTVEGADVEATSERAGCFVGQLEGATTVTRCSATGRIAGSGRYVGGFVGSVADTTALEKCFALAEVSGAGEGTGGFAGFVEGTPAFSECFACGSVETTGGSVGGFAGYVGDAPAFSDCYSLVETKGRNYVGGFAGQTSYCEGTFTRCYAAGATVGSSEVGGFVGRQNRYTPTFADCFRIDDGLADVGSEDVAGIAALDAAGMRSTGNFAAFLETEKWTQADGLTHPYFAWSLADGKMTLGGKIAGTGRGAIRFYDGDGNEGTAFAPGETVTIVAVPDDSVFLGWLGNASYANPSEQTTTVTLDNFRIVTAEFGKLIMNVADLQNVTNALSGSFALGADIDLSEAAWTPIGTSSQPFTGSLYGQGHSISGLTFGNTSSGDANGSHAGLFRYAKDATFVGVVLEDVDLDGYQYVGALAGEVQGATTVRDCSASGTVKSSNGYVGMLVGRVYNANGTVFEGCEAAGAVESAGRYAGGLVGYVGNGTSILGCSAAGSVKATGNYAYAGGLVGGSDGGTFEIRDCVSSAEVTATAAYVGGFIGYVTGSGASVISGCRADGYAGGHGNVGGFVGYVNSPMTISNCVARGDVRSTGSYYGGFVGYFYNDAATIEDCWCSGDVWGTGGTIGSFVGYLRGNGTIEDCSIYAFGAGPRPFCGSDSTFEGGSLSAARIEELTRDWPEVKQHVDGATPISTAEELLAVTNDLAGIYVLTADIDFEGAMIEPIGKSTAFSGEFYGENHKIKNFVIDSTAQYVGLFGRINGGRVNGVRAEGTVTGAYASSGSSTGTGGFAGLIGSQSLVDGCSFEGAVTNTTTYNAGGFVGKTEGAPVLLRSYFVGTVVHQANDKSNAGGFAGDHGGGYVMDCYAIADVEAGNNRYAAGFAGNAGGRIATSWCAGSVESTGNNPGAFAGYAQTGYITDSYYDSGKTDLNAVGNATSYDGISALATEDMLHEASFEGFDFVATWRIDEGATTPYLLAFTVQKTGYELWLEDNGLPEDTAPEAVVDGVPYLIRYVFDRPTGAFSPFTGISFNDDGGVVITMLPIANADAVTVKVLASTSLTDWSHAEETEITVLSDGMIVFPRTAAPARFFRLMVVEE